MFILTFPIVMFVSILEQLMNNLKEKEKIVS